MRRSTAHCRFPLVFILASILTFVVSASASAQQVIRISSYKALPGMDAQISKLTDEEITGEYAGMKGLKWVKFYLDPETGERGSVTLWANGPPSTRT